MNNYAVVDSEGKVINIIYWDGESEWNPPENTVAVKIPDGVFVDIGYSYSGGTFSSEEE